jgi:hypothetical protein
VVYLGYDDENVLANLSIATDISPNQHSVWLAPFELRLEGFFSFRELLQEEPVGGLFTSGSRRGPHEGRVRVNLEAEHRLKGRAIAGPAFNISIPSTYGTIQIR